MGYNGPPPTIEQFITPEQTIDRVEQLISVGDAYLRRDADWEQQLDQYRARWSRSLKPMPPPPPPRKRDANQA